MNDSFRAMMIVDHDGRPRAEFRDLTVADLPDHDVLVEISFSTLNYKDGLAISGKGRIARRLPMVAGIDLAGTVGESRSPDWKATRSWSMAGACPRRNGAAMRASRS